MTAVRGVQLHPFIPSVFKGTVAVILQSDTPWKFRLETHSQNYLGLSRPNYDLYFNYWNYLLPLGTCNLAQLIEQGTRFEFWSHFSHFYQF